jgi:DNA-binding CsgD family transcriptional regulator
MNDTDLPPAGDKAARARRRPIGLCWTEPEPQDCLRDTGIELIGRIPWGSHICMFCQTKQDMLDAACAYFAAARDTEHCIWVVSRPLTVDEATAALMRRVPAFAERHRAGRFEMIAATDWYYENGRFSWEKAVAGWHRCVDEALARGLDGVRACGNPLWRSVEGWRDIVAYEHALDAAIERRRIVVLCSYAMERSRSEDVLDVARSHQAVIARRLGHWEFLQVPGVAHAKREIRLLNGDLAILPERLVREGGLTDRERVVLAQLAKGASSKQVARTLGISPRTVDFHRANMMRKFGAHNTTELVGRVLGEG